MKKFTLDSLVPFDAKHILSRLFPDTSITEGGLWFGKPGECAHKEYHVHEYCEVYIAMQGKGTVDIDGVVHPIDTGDVMIIEPGEDHHLVADQEDPIVNCWFVLK